MYSSGMRTVRLLTVSQHALGEVYPSMHLAGGVCPGGCLPRGGCRLGGCVADTPGPKADIPCGQANACENITFANFVCGQ